MNSPDHVIAISELNRLAKNALEREIPLLWVAGEVSNFTRAASGHLYFNLKDENAQARCVMFRARAGLVPWALSNGQHVEARALVSLYEARGEFQLNIESMRRAGLGKLFEAYTRLKQQLEAEGLFDSDRKQAIPKYPRAIAVVTSLQAAALQDVITAMERRAPNIPVIVYPTSVQGEGTAAKIVAALDAANREVRCDTILLVRGGGSIEDLWAFNDESLARAIASSTLPVIVGVGHETDTTIADFVADRRAATPTAAAELASEGWFSAGQRLSRLHDRLNTATTRLIGNKQQRLDEASRRLLHPAARLQQVRNRLTLLQQRIAAATKRRLQVQEGKLACLSTALTHLNPEATLQRGYAIVMSSDANRVVTDSSQISPGTSVHLRFGVGSADAKITAVRAPQPDD
jgi:exodeoxyribonuclease VII large subunit